MGTEIECAHLIADGHTCCVVPRYRILAIIRNRGRQLVRSAAGRNGKGLHPAKGLEAIGAEIKDWMVLTTINAPSW
jgi:hypothetical protein